MKTEVVFTNQDRTQTLLRFTTTQYSAEPIAIKALIDNVTSEESYIQICKIYNK